MKKQKQKQIPSVKKTWEDGYIPKKQKRLGRLWKFLRGCVIAFPVIAFLAIVLYGREVLQKRENAARTVLRELENEAFIAGYEYIEYGPYRYVDFISHGYIDDGEGYVITYDRYRSDVKDEEAGAPVPDILIPAGASYWDKTEGREEAIEIYGKIDESRSNETEIVVEPYGLWSDPVTGIGAFLIRNQGGYAFLAAVQVEVTLLLLLGAVYLLSPSEYV
ncbi:MAG: hypothetical protein II553_02180 [Lachnospiraceae bacterium]|nr:hypothetical protein [Lachnospiraceae bacterium]